MLFRDWRRKLFCFRFAVWCHIWLAEPKINFPQIIQRGHGLVRDISQYSQTIYSHRSRYNGNKIESNVTVVVVATTNELSQNMNNCPSRSRQKYDKDMDHAFTLIFHNIKRLQEGHSYGSDPNLAHTDAKRDIKPATTLKVPLIGKRSRSEPFLAFAGVQVQQTEASPTRRGTFPELENSLQRRKVRFAEDCRVKYISPKG